MIDLEELIEERLLELGNNRRNIKPNIHDGNDALFLDNNTLLSFEYLENGEDGYEWEYD